MPAARPLERASQFLPRSRIEAVEDLVEQQHASVARECAGDEREATLAVRQREHVSSPQAHQTESLQHTSHTLALRTRRLGQRNVFVEETGGHDLRDGQVPAVAHIFILALRPDVGDAVLVELTGSMLAATGCRPHIAAEHLQQHRLARAVGTDQCPALARAQREVDLVEHDVTVENQGAARQLDERSARSYSFIHHVASAESVSRAARPSASSLSRCASSEPFATGCRRASTSS
jgi:hypothetical protein